MSESKKLSKKSSEIEENTDEMVSKSSSEQNAKGHVEQLKRLQLKVCPHVYEFEFPTALDCFFFFELRAIGNSFSTF